MADDSTSHLPLYHHIVPDYSNSAYLLLFLTILFKLYVNTHRLLNVATTGLAVDFDVRFNFLYPY